MRDSVVIICVLLLGINFRLACQSEDTTKIPLSLRNVVDMAINQSASVKYAQNTNVNYFWRWKNFQTSFRPQLTLTGNLPTYTHTNTPIVQDDGSIKFVYVSQAQASAQVSLSQIISKTGTSIYAATNLYRIQDFIQNSVDYSGSP